MSLSLFIRDRFFRGELDKIIHFLIGFSTVLMFYLWFPLFIAILLSLSVTILKEVYDVGSAKLRGRTPNIPDTIGDLIFGTWGTIFSGTIILVSTHIMFFF